MGALLAQLVQYSGVIHPEIESAYESLSRIPLDDLVRITMAVLRDYDRAFIILDAMDESPATSSRILSQLLKMGNFDANSYAALSIAATSRDLPPSMIYHSSELVIIKAHETDMRRYVRSCMLSSEALQDVIDTDEQIEDITRRVLLRAGDM